MASPGERSSSDALLLVAFVLSGAAALGYELLWTRLLALSLGSETFGVLATLAGFFAGMAVGALVFHRRAMHTRDPVALFVRLELFAAGFAVLSPWLLTGLARLVPAWLGAVAAANSPGAMLASLTVATVVLLPGTVCLGATLAVLASARRRAVAASATAEVEGRGLGRLYAANTAGATAGVLLAVHVILPRLGLGVGAVALASLGVAAAVVAKRWGRGQTLVPEASEVPVLPPATMTRDPDGELLREPWLIYVVVFGSGLAGVGLEVVAVQVLAQNLENTVYTFANILAVYLVGTAIGAAVYQRWAGAAVAVRPAGVTLALLAGLAALVIPTAIALEASPSVLAAVGAENLGLGRAALAELAVAAVVFLVPTAVMGALFAHLLGLLVAAGRGVGRGYALNTLGCAVAPFVCGLWAIPQLGYADALYMVLYVYLVLFAGFGWFRRFHPALLVGGLLAVVALTAAGPRSLALLEPESGWTVLERRETLHGLVMVSEHPPMHPTGQPLRRLQIGKHFKMGGAMSFGERRMGHLCAMLAVAAADAPPPQRGLFLGVGAGATMSAALEFADLQHADGVELVPEVLALLPHFATLHGNLHTAANVSLIPADARRFVSAGRTTYDLVVADLFHPGQDGAGGLYAREHFVQVRERLAPGALMCQWLPLHQLGSDEFKTITRTFLAVFPEVHAFLGHYNAETPALALVGRVPTASAPALRLDLSRMQGLGSRANATILDPRDLLAAAMADTAALTAWVGDGPHNTDLQPRVVFDAPISAYADDAGLGRRNLADLLRLRPAEPAVLLAEPEAARQAAAARTYADAASLYLRAEVMRAGSNDLKNFNPEVAVLLVEAYEADPEFAPARGSLYAVAGRNPAIAEAVLPRMIARTPGEWRVHEAWLRHLQATGDQARLAAALERAAAQFPENVRLP